MRDLLKKLAPGAAVNGYKKARYALISAEFALFGRLPINKKRVVLCNVWGFGDNTKWIARALKKADRSVEVIFITDRAKAEGVPDGIKLVGTNTPAAIRYLATAHIWVDCNRKEPYIRKRKGQIYIQTWHGSLPLKRLEKDYPALSGEYLENARRDSNMTDICLSNGEFMNDLYRKAFGYDCEMIITGSARLDPLLRPNARRVAATKRKLGRLAGLEGNASFKVAVYAPTYRENGELTQFPDLERVRKSLEKRFGSDFLIVKRVHPLVRAIDGKDAAQLPQVVDGSCLGDLYELLEASDVLITDYSNTLFEFAMAGKPVFLFAPDRERYEAERGFYFDYKKLPYPQAAYDDELCRIIEEYSGFDSKNEMEGFFGNLGIREDGRASARIAQLILRKIYR